MNAVLPLDRDDGSVAGAPLLWVQQREMKVAWALPPGHTYQRHFAVALNLCAYLQCKRQQGLP